MNYTLLIIYAIGVLTGMLVGNANFRKKFFVGFRKFLVQINRGARNYNKNYERSQYPHKAEENKAGSYVNYAPNTVKCPRCNGMGVLRKRLPSYVQGIPGVKNYVECPDCEGTGRVYESEEMK